MRCEQAMTRRQFSRLLPPSGEESAHGVRHPFAAESDGALRAYLTGRHRATPDVRPEYRHVRMDDGATLAGMTGTADISRSLGAIA